MPVEINIRLTSGNRLRQQVALTGIPPPLGWVHAIYCPVGCNRIAREFGHRAHVEVLLNVFAPELDLVLTKQDTG